MTDHVTEMMQTAGIEPIKIIKNFPTYEAASKFGFKLTGTPKLNKGKFKIGSYTNNQDVFQVHWSEYPDFTTEKQLELIKLISINRIGKDYKILEIDRDEIDNLYYFSLTNKEDKCQSKYVSNKDFTQALAQLTTELMNAGELDKEKVKEILENAR